MNALDRFEVWLITGSQHLYGETALGQVAEQSRQVAAGLDGADAIPVSVVHKAPVTSPESIRDLLPRGERLRTVRRPDRLDAHLLSREDVDRRSPRAPEAAPPPAHAVQPRAPVGRGRHGLHEPEPVGARGSGVRLPRDANAHPTEDRRRDTGRSRRVLERIGTWSRAACGWHEAQSLRVARFGDNMRAGRGHGRRQGRGADSPRRLGQRVRRRRARVGGRRRGRRERRPA